MTDLTRRGILGFLVAAPAIIAAPKLMKLPTRRALEVLQPKIIHNGIIRPLHDMEAVFTRIVDAKIDKLTRDVEDYIYYGNLGVVHTHHIVNPWSMREHIMEVSVVPERQHEVAMAAIEQKPIEINGELWHVQEYTTKPRYRVYGTMNGRHTEMEYWLDTRGEK